MVDAKSEQFEEFDLGRSDLSNPGLIRFKDHLGGTQIPLTYWRVPEAKKAGSGLGLLHRPSVQAVLTRLPDPIFRFVGRILYRHAG
jgi:hypothetical protein